MAPNVKKSVNPENPKAKKVFVPLKPRGTRRRVQFLTAALAAIGAAKPTPAITELVNHVLNTIGQARLAKRALTQEEDESIAPHLEAVSAERLSPVKR